MPLTKAQKQLRVDYPDPTLTFLFELGPAAPRSRAAAASKAKKDVPLKPTPRRFLKLRETMKRRLAEAQQPKEW
ncbi:MAG: hypothetical protein RIQ41_167 [Candidatus Parcubacteria bacterium]|jgi:hypothetical protein